MALAGSRIFGLETSQSLGSFETYPQVLGDFYFCKVSGVILHYIFTHWWSYQQISKNRSFCFLASDQSYLAYPFLWNYSLIRLFSVNNHFYLKNSNLSPDRFFNLVNCGENCFNSSLNVNLWYLSILLRSKIFIYLRKFIERFTSNFFIFLNAPARFFKPDVWQKLNQEIRFMYPNVKFTRDQNQCFGLTLCMRFCWYSSISQW